MRKIEVILPVELAKPLQTALISSGIKVCAGATFACSLFGAGSSATKNRMRLNYRKVEWVLPDQLALPAIEIVTAFFLKHHCQASLNHFVLLNLEGCPPLEDSFQCSAPDLRNDTSQRAIDS